MFILRRPSDAKINGFLSQCESDTFSYPEVGSTAGHVTSGYNIDHNRIKLGEGSQTFERAREAVRAWKMFGFDWVTLCWPDTPIESGRTVAILVQHLNFYSLNAARIVYTIDETGDIERFGFAYGTLTNHGEIGEERFSVEHHRKTGEVWYDLYAFSRPGSALAKLGYPVSRYFQKAFAADSKSSMLRAVL